MRRPKNAYYFPLPLPSSFFLLFSFLSPCLLLLVPSSRAGCGALNTHPAPFFFPPGGCDALNTLSSLSLSLSVSLSLSLFLSLFRPFPFFLFFFFPSLGYLLYFLLGMACSSSASLPSRLLSSTRSRSFLRCLGLLPSETRNLASPLFLFLVWGFARGDPTWGLSVSFGLPCSVCFLLGSSPGFGACFFSPRKSGTRPSLRGVRVRSGRIPCHHISAQGARQLIL